MVFSRLRAWFERVFFSKKPEMSDSLIKCEYVLTGWDFATAVSQITMGETRNIITLLTAWECAEKRYSDRGFRTVPLDDFVKYATLGIPLRGVGDLREPEEIVILHAPYYRVYTWRKPHHVHDLMSKLRDDGHLAEDYSHARQRKRTT